MRDVFDEVIMPIDVKRANGARVRMSTAPRAPLSSFFAQGSEDFLDQAGCVATQKPTTTEEEKVHVR